MQSHSVALEAAAVAVVPGLPSAVGQPGPSLRQYVVRIFASLAVAGCYVVIEGAKLHRLWVASVDGEVA